MKPIIDLTLIVPTYNRPSMTLRALRSISMQDVQPRHIIVADDASSPPFRLDSTCSMQNVKLVHRKTNGGAAAARNTAMRLVETSWASFLDSDDQLTENSLSARWAMLVADQKQSPSPSTIYGCGWREFNPLTKEEKVRFPRPSSRPLDFASGCWFSPGSCVIMNTKEAMVRVGGQDENLRRLEDFDWFLALALAGFTLNVFDIIGADIERDNPPAHSITGEAAERILRKWRGIETTTAVRRRMKSYLALEQAASLYYQGQYLRAGLQIAHSIAMAPRLGLQLSPGWVCGNR